MQDRVPTIVLSTATGGFPIQGQEHRRKWGLLPAGELTGKKRGAPVIRRSFMPFGVTR
jgi:hypothetical protein